PDGQPGRIVRSIRAFEIGGGRIAAEPAVDDCVEYGEQSGQCPYHRGLGGTLLSADQHPANGRRHRVEQQRQPKVGHAHDGGERIRWYHFSPPPRVSTPAGRPTIRAAGVSWLPDRRFSPAFPPLTRP